VAHAVDKGRQDEEGAGRGEGEPESGFDFAGGGEVAAGAGAEGLERTVTLGTGAFGLGADGEDGFAGVAPDGLGPGNRLRREGLPLRDGGALARQHGSCHDLVRQ